MNRRTEPLRAVRTTPAYSPPAPDGWSTAGKVLVTPITAVLGAIAGFLVGGLGMVATGAVAYVPIGFFNEDLAYALASWTVGAASLLGGLGGLVVGALFPWGKLD